MSPSPAHAHRPSGSQTAGRSIQWVARIGYAARGAVYLIIGSLALLAALGSGGKTAGSRGALQSLQDEPYGQVLLIAAGLGLACYAVWRGIQTVLDPSDHGSDAKGLAIRGGLGVSALTHAFLAIYAISLVLGWGFGPIGGGSGSGGSGSVQSWSGRLLAWPGGRWVLGAAALLVVVAGVAQILRGARKKYRRHLRLDANKQKWVDPVCQAGLYAKGFVFCVVGTMLAVAAWQHDQYEAGGFGKGLSALRQQPFGRILLGVVALGLLAFGVYSFIEAAYRRVGVESSTS